MSQAVVLEQTGSSLAWSETPKVAHRNTIEDISSASDLIDSSHSTDSYFPLEYRSKISRDMRFATLLYVRPANAQTSLRICAV